MLQGDSARFQQQAKEGLGKVGSLVVDAGISTGQSLLDNALGAATGTGMLPFVARSFGGAAQEARQSGADTSEQLAYGAGQAAKEFVTEKLFGLTGPQRLTGGGSLDDAIETGIRNTTERLAKTAKGQKALGVLMTWLSGGATEGAEEVIGSVLENTLVNPFLRAFDPDGRTARQKFEDGLYDALVGAASGLMGGVTSLGYQANPQAGARTTQNAAQEAPGARLEAGQGSGTTQAQNAARTAQTGPENIFTQTADAIREEGDRQVRETVELMQRAAGMEMGQQEAAPGTGTADMSLVERIQQSVPQLQSMEPVADMKGNELPSGGKLIDRLTQFASSFGNKVFRPGFGEVFFSKGKLKSSMIGHGMGGAKIKTFPAVPAIIQRGQQIDFQPNWKGRNYDTYTFAAPVNYKGNRTYIGVIVAKDKQSSRYYLHEVVDEHGNVIFQNTEAPTAVQDGTSALSGDLDTVPAAGAAQMSPSDGRASQMGTVDTVETSGVEGTSAFNTDSTIPQGADSVKPSGTDGLGAWIYTCK